MGKGKPRRNKSAKSEQPEKQSLLSQIFYEFVGAAIGEVIGYVLFGLLFMGGAWTRFGGVGAMMFKWLYLLLAAGELAMLAMWTV